MQKQHEADSVAAGIPDPDVESTPLRLDLRPGDYIAYILAVGDPVPLADLLQAIDDGYRWEEDTTVVWSSIDLGPDDQGLYDLGELGWVFFELPLAEA